MEVILWIAFILKSQALCVFNAVRVVGIEHTGDKLKGEKKFHCYALGAFVHLKRRVTANQCKVLSSVLLPKILVRQHGINNDIASRLNLV